MCRTVIVDALKIYAEMKIIYKIAAFFHCLDRNNSLYY